MTVLTFPSNPTLGQQYNAPNQIQYVYDGVKWIVETVSSTSDAVTNSIQDRVAPIFVNGPNQGINFAYNAGTNVMNASVTAVNGNRLVNGARSLILESNGNITTPEFTIPNAVGTSGQVLKWPSSGSTLVWGSDSIFSPNGALILPSAGSIRFPDTSVQTTAYLGVPGLSTLAGVAITSPLLGQVLKYNGSNWINAADANTGGTVTSVSVSGGTTGLTSTGGPITTSGTLTLGGTLVAANGGTGVATLSGIAFGNGTSAFTVATAAQVVAAISTTAVARSTNIAGGVAGSLLYQSALNSTSLLPIGTAGQVLTVSGGLPIWSTAGTGDVVGPASATANGIALFDGTTGKLLKDSATTDGLINGLTIGKGNFGGVNGFSNTALGVQALMFNIEGQSNTAVGFNGCQMITTGDNNTAVGVQALSSTATGWQNTAIGQGALEKLVTGDQNTALGAQAGSSFLTGSNNTYIGHYAGIQVLAGDNNTILGAFYSTGTSLSDTVIIAAGATERFRILASGAWSIGATGTNYGTAGQVLTSGGSGAAPSWTSGGTTTIYTAGSTTGTITPNVANSNLQTITLTGNITLNALASPISGQSITLIITQPATGGPYLLTSTMKFAGGAKTLSTGANAVDMLTIRYIGTTYYAILTTGFA